jgi:ABC-type phosphate/phosphonate transport system permease subunit
VGGKPGSWFGRNMRKAALVGMFVLAVLASPVALPIKMLIARRQRPTVTTEQVVRLRSPSGRTLPRTV